MATLEEVRVLWTSLDTKAQIDLYALAFTDPDASFQRMIEISAEHGLTITLDEIKAMSGNAAVQQFILDLSENDEFDDVELDEAALAAVSGGKEGRRPTGGAAPKGRTHFQKTGDEFHNMGVGFREEGDRISKSSGNRGGGMRHGGS